MYDRHDLSGSLRAESLGWHADDTVGRGDASPAQRCRADTGSMTQPPG